MILLLTGQPGHGKTALGLVRAKKLKDEGRTVYVHGVRGLNCDFYGFQQLEDPTKWEDLPDGSVVVLDECYSTFPSRAPGRAVPAHVDAMARHRHRGFDFILICQQGLQLDSFLRGLVEEHIHVRRKWGTRATKLKRWTQYQGNTSVSCMDTSDWIRPAWVFKGYESTVMDTSKVRIPRWFVILLAMICAVVGGTYLLKRNFEAGTQAATAGTAGNTGGTPGVAAGRAVVRSYASAEDYLADQTPRVESVPSSAPLYDGRPVKQVPVAYCVASKPGTDAQGEFRKGGCTCYTQQMTIVPMHPDACDALAHGRGSFDPFLDPPKERQQGLPAAAGGAGGAPPAVEAATAAAPALEAATGITSAEQVASYGGFRTGG